MSGGRHSGEPPSAPASEPLIMICYRREDSAAVTGRIYDRLIQHFGKTAIFKDVDSIPLGVDFREHLERVVVRSAALVVVIGDKWLERGGPGGVRRLDDPADIVRIEIESALNRGIPVIPLLVQGARMPTGAGLPPSLRALADRNGTSIGHDPHFHPDLDRVIASLETTLRLSSSDPLEPAGVPRTVDSAVKVRGASSRRRPVVVVTVFALWLGAGLFFYATLGETLTGREQAVLLAACAAAVAVAQLISRWFHKVIDRRP
jgi:hypothetical protein